MISSSVRFLATPFFLAALICCGGTTNSSGDGGGPRGDGGTADGSGGSCPANLSGTPTGRPAATMCAPTMIPLPATDGGTTSCTTDSNCAGNTYARTCRNGSCAVDQCFTDSDCPSGQACACSNEQVGNAIHTNSCVMAQCRVDSDCGAGEVCSVTATDLCSGGGPFFACHSSADKCRVDSDCCPSAPSCRYESTVGHWECSPRCTIAG